MQRGPCLAWLDGCARATPSSAPRPRRALRVERTDAADGRLGSRLLRLGAMAASRRQDAVDASDKGLQEAGGALGVPREVGVVRDVEERKNPMDVDASCDAGASGRHVARHDGLGRSLGSSTSVTRHLSGSAATPLDQITINQLAFLPRRRGTEDAHHWDAWQDVPQEGRADEVDSGNWLRQHIVDGDDADEKDVCRLGGASRPRGWLRHRRPFRCPSPSPGVAGEVTTGRFPRQICSKVLFDIRAPKRRQAGRRACSARASVTAMAWPRMGADISACRSLPGQSHSRSSPRRGRRGPSCKELVLAQRLT